MYVVGFRFCAARTSHHRNACCSVMTIAWPLAFDCHERSDRRVRPDLRGGVEGELDAAEALGCPEGGAGERVQRFAAVEVADPADAGVVVARAVGVGAAHAPDRDVLEDWPGAERGRGGGNTRVAGRGEHGVAVVPERE